MNKVNFTVSRISGFLCPEGKQQAFMWDSRALGLGVRATSNGQKSYIFQAKLNGTTIRITIGDVRTWLLDKAQDEARRLHTLIDQGLDPRAEKAKIVAEQKQVKETQDRLDTTVATAWNAYLDDRKPRWSERHYQDHIKLSDAGGKPFKRGKGITNPGLLSRFMQMKLTELEPERISEWLKSNNAERATMTALAFRVLKAFVNWVNDSAEYQNLIPEKSVTSRAVKDHVVRVKEKQGDCLQKEQLAPWFEAVITIKNPVQSAYLQGLLLTGARREELAKLTWKKVDFTWKQITLDDKIEGTAGREIPLTAYFASLLQTLKVINETPPEKHILKRMKAKGIEWKPSGWVFASKTSESGYLSEPRIAHTEALKSAELPHISIHGLRRSFGTLAEWVECPTGVSAQIMGHKPTAIAEKHYRRRSVDLLRKWHQQIEDWILKEAGVRFGQANKKPSLADTFLAGFETEQKFGLSEKLEKK